MGLQGAVRSLVGFGIVPVKPRKPPHFYLPLWVTTLEADMHQVLINYVDAYLDNAATFCTQFMPSLGTDEAYEELLRNTKNSTPEMIAALHAAAQYMPATPRNQRFDGRILTPGEEDLVVFQIDARLNSTNKWPMFLFPSHRLEIRPGSKLLDMLALPLQVATDWAQLIYVWRCLKAPLQKLSGPQLVHLMPWLRECLANIVFDVSLSLAEKQTIRRELATIMRDNDVLVYPRLAKGLREIALSGNRLISQYRIIEAAYRERTLTQATLTIFHSDELVPSWVPNNLTEAMSTWQVELNARLRSSLSRKQYLRGLKGGELPNG